MDKNFLKGPWAEKKLKMRPTEGKKFEKWDLKRVGSPPPAVIPQGAEFWDHLEASTFDNHHKVIKFTSLSQTETFQVFSYGVRSFASTLVFELQIFCAKFADICYLLLWSHCRNYGEHKGLAVLNSELSKLSP